MALPWAFMACTSTGGFSWTSTRKTISWAWTNRPPFRRFLSISRPMPRRAIWISNFFFSGGWYKPTIGAIYTVTRWDSALSALDGHTVRVQGGVRLGHSFTSAGVVIEPTVAAMLYSDVVIEGGNITTVGLTTPTDEGKLFELGSLKLNFDFGKGLSTSVEAEVRHGSLDHGAEVVGAAGRVGVRYKW